VLPVPPVVHPGAPASKSSLKKTNGTVPTPQSPGAARVVNDQVGDHGPVPQLLAARTLQKYSVLVSRSLLGVALVPGTVVVKTTFVNAASVATSMVWAAL